MNNSELTNLFNVFLGRIGVDDEMILNFPTPTNGYWGYGGFTGTNPWTQAGRDAPFDKEVRA